MLSRRKRKPCPEKDSENSKKVRVDNKVFRNPEPSKHNSVAKTKISRILPEGYNSIILTANTKPEENCEGNEALYGCVRLPVITKEDALIWIKKFERVTFTLYHSPRNWQNDPQTGLFSRKFLCNYRTSNESGGEYNCKACLIFTIKDAKEVQTNPDYYLRDYPSQVIIQFCHNHRIDPDTHLKNLRPSTELRIIFSTYFAKGHSPFTALVCHKCDLHSFHGSEFYDIITNGGICPSYNWCFREYEKLFKRKFLEPRDNELKKLLRDAISQYNTKCRSDCAILLDNPFVLSICTPLMKSIFRSGFAEDLITVRSFCTPKNTSKRQKLILFLCHTPIGSLPFGIVLAVAEDTESICEGIKTLIGMLGICSYIPKTIITDENPLVNKSLKKSFPKSQILFNEFQMLQSIWRIIRLVCQDDDEEFQTLYNLFLVTLNSDSEEEFTRNFDGLLIYAEKYPKLTNFLKYFKFRSDSYVLYARPKVEFNTDVLNYTDSGTIILQDVSIKYSNFFNVLQLFEFLTKNYVTHYERKLVRIVEGDLKGFFKTNFFAPLNKIACFTCEKISDTEFLISLNDMKFFVNAELDTCTCQVGVQGGSCVHQYIVEKNLGLVPECYTPLGDDMLNIFKSILSYTNDSHNRVDSSSDEMKFEARSSTDDVDDFIPSDHSSQTGSIHDTDSLGPLDEIYLASSEVADSFTNEPMSPLSEFEDFTEDNDDILHDTGQYNRESDELEPIEPSIRPNKATSLQENALVDVDLSTSDGNIAATENVIAYDYTDEDTQCNNEEVVPAENSLVLTTDIHEYDITENAVVNQIDTPAVCTYTTEHEGRIQIYKRSMTESDKKTAEIAEFLTNLPDTNNLNYNVLNSANPVVSSAEPKDSGEPQEASDVIEQFQQQIVPVQEVGMVSGGVHRMKNDEFFTQYRVMENGVLSIVTDTDDEYSNQINTFQTVSVQDIMGDSYEETNLVMMSPTDLFGDNDNVENPNAGSEKMDPKINVLSSVVIKPSDDSSGDREIFIPSAPLNLDTIKHKTLRNVKEDSRSKISEPTVTQNVIFVHNISDTEPKKIILPTNEKSYEERDNSLKTGKVTENGKNLEVVSIKSLEEEYERDVIQLYCNQSGNKSSSKHNRVETNTKKIEETVTQENCNMPESILKKGSVQEAQCSIDTHELDETEEVCETMHLTECDPAELAEGCFADVVDMDSDDLEELASLNYDTYVVSSPQKQELKKIALAKKSPLKLIPIKEVPLKITEKNLFSSSGSSTVQSIPLRDFLFKNSSNIASSMKLLADRASDKRDFMSDIRSKNSAVGKSSLEGEVTTSSSQGLVSKLDFGDSKKKFLETFEERSILKKLGSAVEDFEPCQSAKLKNRLQNTADIIDNSKRPKSLKLKEHQNSENSIVESDAVCKNTDDCKKIVQRKLLGFKDREFTNSDSDISLYSSGDGFSSSEFQHYSDCRTSCSEFHSELEGLDDLSDRDFYDLESTVKKSSDDHNALKELKIDSNSSKIGFTDVQLSNVLPADIRVTKSKKADSINLTKVKEKLPGDHLPGMNKKLDLSGKVGFKNQKKKINKSSSKVAAPSTKILSKSELPKTVGRKLIQTQFGYMSEDSDFSYGEDIQIKKGNNGKTKKPYSKKTKISKEMKNILSKRESQDSDLVDVTRQPKSQVPLLVKNQKCRMFKKSIVNNGKIIEDVKKEDYSTLFKLSSGVSVVRVEPANRRTPVSDKKLSVTPTISVPKKGALTYTVTPKDSVNFNITSKEEMNTLPEKEGKSLKRKTGLLKVQQNTTKRKDAKKIETILTSGIDIDSNTNDTDHETNMTIKDNSELSFLYNNPRFEIIVEGSEGSDGDQKSTNLMMHSKESIGKQRNVEDEKTVEIAETVEWEETIEKKDTLEAEQAIGEQYNTSSIGKSQMAMPQSEKTAKKELDSQQLPGIQMPHLIYLYPPVINANILGVLNQNNILSLITVNQNSYLTSSPVTSTPLKTFLSSSATRIKCQPALQKGHIPSESKGSKVLLDVQNGKNANKEKFKHNSKQSSNGAFKEHSDTNHRELNKKRGRRSKSLCQGVSREVEELTRVTEEFMKQKIPSRKVSTFEMDDAKKLNEINLKASGTRRPQRISESSVSTTVEKGKQSENNTKQETNELRYSKSKEEFRPSTTLSSEYKQGKPRKLETTRKREFKSPAKLSLELEQNKPNKPEDKDKVSGNRQNRRERKSYNRTSIKKNVLNLNESVSSSYFEHDNASQNDAFDIETSIKASVLEKGTDSIKERPLVITSTPVRYEDAFKMFLETSSSYRFEPTKKAFSDYEDYSDSDSSTGTRRAKSVCSPKRPRSSLSNKSPDTPRMKKSVSWAEGLNIIEYTKETDSDDSEIIKAPKQTVHKKRHRANSPNNKRGVKTFSDNLRHFEDLSELSMSPANKRSRNKADVDKRKQNRSRSVSLKHATARVNVKNKNLSRSSTRTETPKLELIVLLERNIEIELMCQPLRKYPPRRSRSSRGQRRGYKELLESAQRLKFLEA